MGPPFGCLYCPIPSALHLHGQKQRKKVFWKHYFYTHPQTYTHNWTEGKHLKSGKKTVLKILFCWAHYFRIQQNYCWRTVRNNLQFRENL